MLKYILVMVGFLVVLGGSADARESCEGPWLTSAQLLAASPAERTQQQLRLLGCAKQVVADAQALSGNLSDVRFDELLNGLADERDRLAGLLETRTAALANANAELAELVRERDKLIGQVETQTKKLEIARAETDEARARVAALESKIAMLVVERDQLKELLETRTAELEKARGENATSANRIVELENERKRLSGQVETLTGELGKAKAEIAELKDKTRRLTGVVETQTAALKLANARIADLESERDQLKRQVETLTTELEKAKAEIADLVKERDRLTAAIGKAEARIGALEDELKKAGADIAALTDELRKARAEIAALTDELKKARAEIAALTTELARARAEIADLTCKVDRLGTERSEFFVRLREILGKDSGVTIVGDRFVFPSEVLFPVGSAALNKDGMDQIAKVAGVVRDLEGKIPPSISWVLQVNGHTDRQPILGGGKFKNNWELSTARALTVVELLEKERVPPQHLAAAGFGEHQPLLLEQTPEAYRKNRRIELKLTDDGAGHTAAVGADSTECPQLVSMR